MKIIKTKDGVVVRNENGSFYYKNRTLADFHRLDGPAVDCSKNALFPGLKEYWIDGKEYSEKEYYRIINLLSFI